MKRVLIASLAVLPMLLSAAPDAARQEFDDGVLFLSFGAYGAANEKFDATLKSFEPRMANLKTVEDAAVLLEEFMVALGDQHGAVLRKEELGRLNPAITVWFMTLDGGYVVGFSPDADPNLLRQVRLGDRLLRVNGVPLEQQKKTSMKGNSGDEVTYEFVRGHQKFSVKLKLAAQQNDPAMVTQALSKGVNYFLMPSLTPGQFAQASEKDGGPYVKEAIQRLNRLSTPATCGLVVDLRLNGGALTGSQLALASLLFDPGHQFLKFKAIDGLVAYDSAGPGRVTATNSTKGVVLTANASALAKQAPRNRTPWIASLSGPLTASSAEMVLIAARNNDHTRTFGETTAGAATHRGTATLPSGNKLEFSSSFFQDAKGNTFPEGIYPDVQVKINPATFGQASDPVILAARNWLKSKGCQ